MDFGIHLTATIGTVIAIIGASLWFYTLPYCHIGSCSGINDDLWQITFSFAHTLGAFFFWIVIFPAVLSGLLSLSDLNAWVKGEYIQKKRTPV